MLQLNLQEIPQRSEKAKENLSCHLQITNSANKEAFVPLKLGNYPYEPQQWQLKVFWLRNHMWVEICWFGACFETWTGAGWITPECWHNSNCPGRCQQQSLSLRDSRAPWWGKRSLHSNSAAVCKAEEVWNGFACNSCMSGCHSSISHKVVSVVCRHPGDTQVTEGMTLRWSPLLGRLSPPGTAQQTSFGLHCGFIQQVKALFPSAKHNPAFPPPCNQRNQLGL